MWKLSLVLVLCAAAHARDHAALLCGGNQAEHAAAMSLVSVETSPEPFPTAPPAAHAVTDSAPPASPTLRQRIDAYRASGGQRWYVGGANTSAGHLMLDHGWSSAQVSGLTQDELNLLHGASHTGRITPQTFNVSVQKPPESTQAAEDGIPVELKADGNAYWTHPTLGRRFSNGQKLVEGANYRGLIYRDGRMWPESKAAPKVEPVIPQQGYWQTQCFGGQCRQVWVPFAPLWQ